MTRCSHRHRGFVLIACVVLASMAPTRTADAGPSWYRVVTPHFTVVSDAGEQAATRVAVQFEQARAAIQHIWPWARFDAGRPVLVLALTNEPDFRALRPLAWNYVGGLYPSTQQGYDPYYQGDLRYSSAFFDGQERRFVMLISDSVLRFEPKRTDVNPHAATYWACASLAIDSNLPSHMPPWFTRGLAEVIANTIVRSDGVTFGQYVPWTVDNLRSRRLSFEELTGAGWESPLLKDDTWRRMFDASAWALVHYLMLGDAGANLPRFYKAMTAIAGGADADETFAAEYGGRGKIAEVYAVYERQAQFAYRKVDARIDVPVERFKVERLTVEDAVALKRSVLAAQGRSAELPPGALREP